MRIMVIGTSGAGKSTFARRVAEAVGAPHIELDAINWQAGWRDLNSHDPVEFRRRVLEATRPEAWVSDGNYGWVLDLLLTRATHLIWLDYSRRVVMSRVLRRSLVRALTGQELWPGTGNREEFRRWLSKEHPLRWAWDTHRDRRRRFDILFADPAWGQVSKHRLRRPADAETLIARLCEEARGAPPAGGGAC